MTQRRQSKRTSAVTKRRILEEKLEKRKLSSEINKQKVVSKKLQTLQKKQFETFTKEALRLSDCVNRLLSEQSQENINLDDPLERTVNEIITDIESLDDTTENQNLLNNLSLVLDKSARRRLTSTDFDFLESPVIKTNSFFPHSLWPPRYPSQEPEEISLVEPLILRRKEEDWVVVEEEESSEVFEVESNPELTDALTEDILTETYRHLLRPDLRYSSSSEETSISPATGNKMEEENFKQRMKTVTLAAKKVSNFVKKFSADDITEVDLDDYKAKLNQIHDKLHLYDEAVDELIVDLDGDDPTDTGRVAQLERDKESLL